jgi:hypothetical protein
MQFELVLILPLSLQALGCILYTLCFLLHPFQDAGSLGILSAKIKFPEAPIAPEVKVVLMRMLDVRQPLVRSEELQHISSLICFSHSLHSIELSTSIVALSFTDVFLLFNLAGGS